MLAMFLKGETVGNHERALAVSLKPGIKKGRGHEA